MRLHVSAAVGPSFDHAVGAQQQRGGIARPSAFAALMLPATSTPLESFSSSTSSNPDNQPDYPSFRLISLLELTTLPVAVTFSSANQVALRLIAQPTPPELHHDPARPLVAGLGNALLGLAVAAAIRRGSEPDATRHLAPIMRVIMKLPAACLTHDRQRPAYSRRASEIPPTHGRDHRCGPNGNVAGRRARTSWLRHGSLLGSVLGRLAGSREREWKAPDRGDARLDAAIGYRSVWPRSRTLGLPRVACRAVQVEASRRECRHDADRCAQDAFFGRLRAGVLILVSPERAIDGQKP